MLTSPDVGPIAGMDVSDMKNQGKLPRHEPPAPLWRKFPGATEGPAPVCTPDDPAAGGCVRTYPERVEDELRLIDEAQQRGDRVALSRRQLVLARLHLEAGHAAAAIPCLQSALTGLKRAAPPDRLVAEIWAEMAVAYRHLHDVKAALHATAQVEMWLPPSEQVEGFTAKARNEIEKAQAWLSTGDLTAAAHCAERAGELARSADLASQRKAELTRGLIELLEPGRRDIGLSRLRQAALRLRDLSASEQQEALGWLVQGAQICGREDDALAYLEEAARARQETRIRSLIDAHHRRLHSLGYVAGTQAVDLQSAAELLEHNAVAVELHDDDTGKHCYRVGTLAGWLARKAGLAPGLCEQIEICARLHDIGKLRVPDAVLLKPGRFTPEDRAVMHQHCQAGWDLLGQCSMPELFVAQEIALNHHERWDGCGYPNRRAGNQIPLAARLVALADVFDALTHARCYKPAWSMQAALQEIADQRGRQFDPDLTDLFVAMMGDFADRDMNSLDRELAPDARIQAFFMRRVAGAFAPTPDPATFDARR